MSNLDNRLSRLEDEQAPKDTKIFRVYYDPATGIATKKSSAELVGLTQEEIKTRLAQVDDKNVVLLTVVYLPDNGRDE